MDLLLVALLIALVICYLASCFFAYMLLGINDGLNDKGTSEYVLILKALAWPVTIWWE